MLAVASSRGRTHGGMGMLLIHGNSLCRSSAAAARMMFPLALATSSRLRLQCLSRLDAAASMQNSV